MQAPKLEIWYRPDEPRRPFHTLDGETVHARTAEIESAFQVALRRDAARTRAVANDAADHAAFEGGGKAPAGRRPGAQSAEADDDPAQRLEEWESAPGEPVPVPLICRMPFDCDDPTEALETLPEEICDALEGAGRNAELDPYPLATALHELGVHLSAVALLERAIRRRGATLAACELMGKCLLALGRPDLAMLWFLRPVQDPELEFESLFELVRQASACQMEMQLAPEEEPKSESPGRRDAGAPSDGGAGRWTAGDTSLPAGETPALPVMAGLVDGRLVTLHSRPARRRRSQ